MKSGFYSKYKGPIESNELAKIFEETLREQNLETDDLLNPEQVVKFDTYLNGILQALSYRLKIPLETLKMRANGITGKKRGLVSIIPSI